MVVIRFPKPEAERHALGYLAGRFSFKSWADGRMLVPESALSALATEDISFTVEGHARYEQCIPPLRNPPAAAV